MNKNKEEITILNIQLITTVLFISSLIISILLTYNEKLRLEKKQTILNKKNNNNLSFFNRIFSVILALIFLYTAYANKKIAIKKQEPLDSYSLQITASQLSLIAALIALYIIIKSQGEDYTIIANIENPSL